MRLAQTQVWPAFLYFEAMAPLTAISMSASSKTMNGALPPNSIEVFLTVAAHCCISNLPTSVEPMKVGLRRTYLLGVDNVGEIGLHPGLLKFSKNERLD
jgi:hypothetical protein